jgi:hypothetical protein
LHNDYSHTKLRETLAAMPAFRESMTLDRLLGYGSIASITVAKPDEPTIDMVFYSSGAAALAKCLDNDFRRLGAAELERIAPGAPKGELYMQIEFRSPSAWDSQKFYNDSIEYFATSSYAETIEWLDRNPPDKTIDRSIPPNAPFPPD